MDPNNNTNDSVTRSDHFAQLGQTAPIFKMEKEWEQSVIRLPKEYEDDSRTPFTKMIIWNNKPYLIIISLRERNYYRGEDIEIIMVDPKETDINHRNRDYLHQITRRIRGISWSINQSTCNLYITIICDAYKSPMPKFETFFLIYDLNAWKLKKRYLLNFKMNNGENFDDHFIRNISIINNNNFKTVNMTSFHIINNWSRTNMDTSTVIPKDICVLIDQFYSFCVKKNTLQLILFGVKFDLIQHGREWYLHHAIMDVNSVINNDNDDSVIDLELINSQQISPMIIVVSGEEHLRIKQILSIRIDYELYIMFSTMTLRINLETGTMRKESKLLPYDHMGFGNFIAYDSISCIDSMYDNGNSRYLFVLMEDRGKSMNGSKTFNLWYFDKKNKTFFKDYKDNDTKTCFPDLYLEKTNGSTDMICHGNEVIVVGNDYWQDNIWIYRTTLTSS